MYIIKETTDNKFLGHEFNSDLKIGNEIILSDGVVFEIQTVLKTPDFVVLSNPNYIIIATEV